MAYLLGHEAATRRSTAAARRVCGSRLFQREVYVSQQFVLWGVALQIQVVEVDGEVAQFLATVR
jgi:hypothetical protein